MNIFFKYQGGSNILNKWNLKQNKATTKKIETSNTHMQKKQFIQIYSNEFENLDERDRFLGKHNLAEQH